MCLKSASLIFTALRRYMSNCNEIWQSIEHQEFLSNIYLNCSDIVIKWQTIHLLVSKTLPFNR